MQGLLLCPGFDELCGQEERAHEWAADLANATALRFKGLTPSIGSTAGGTEITIFGRGFTFGDLSVTIGGVDATVVAVLAGGTAAQVITPVGPTDGAADVVVRDQFAGTEDIGFSAFEYGQSHPVALKDTAVHLYPGDNATFGGTADLQSSHTWHQVFFSADRAGSTVYFSACKGANNPPVLVVSTGLL